MNDCPQVRNRAPNAWKWGGTTPVLPPPPVPPVQEDPKPAKTADRANLAETPTSGNGSPELFSATAISTAADVSQQKKWRLLLPRQNGKSPHSDSEDDTAKKGKFADTESSDPGPEDSPSPSPPEDKSYQLFITALQKSGWERSKLMQGIPGVSYYHCRGLFLQHTHGDWSKDKALSVRPGNKDAENWKVFKGFIQQDAFAILLKEFKDLRVRYHIFSSC